MWWAPTLIAMKLLGILLFLVACKADSLGEFLSPEENAEFVNGDKIFVKFKIAENQGVNHLRINFGGQQFDLSPIDNIVQCEGKVVPDLPVGQYMTIRATNILSKAQRKVATVTVIVKPPPQEMHDLNEAIFQLNVNNLWVASCEYSPNQLAPDGLWRRKPARSQIGWNQ